MLEAACRAEARLWWTWSRSVEGRKHLDKADQQLPEPFAGWGPGSAVRLLVIGQSPGTDKREQIPRSGANLESYFQYYWRRFSHDPQHRDSEGRIIKIRTNGTATRNRHYNDVEEALGGPRLGLDALYVDSIPWKGAVLNFAASKETDRTTIAKQRLARFLPCVHSVGGRRRVIVLGQWACWALFGDSAWAPLPPRTQRISFADYGLEVLTMYHPNAQPRIWDIRCPDPGLTDYRSQVREVLVKNWVAQS